MSTTDPETSLEPGTITDPLPGEIDAIQVVIDEEVPAEPLRALVIRTGPKRGLFITFEGPDGSGKSTQLRLLGKRLRGAHHDVLETAEPGGTPIGTQIRRILLDAKNQELSPTAELLLMFAARAQNVDQWILPALAAGKIVLCDRFTDSTLVYQGAGRGLGTEVVYEVDRVACRGLIPDLTLVIDIDVDAGLTRARRRNERAKEDESRIDEQSVAFHRSVRDAYHRLAEEEPHRVKLIDGARPEIAVSEDVWAQVVELQARSV